VAAPTVYSRALGIFNPTPDQFWTPYPKQSAAVALSGTVFELLYGGAAGGGKSAFLRGYACDFAASHPGAHIALIRRTLPQLRQTHGIHLPEMLTGKATPNRSEFTWVFPNGSILRFISLPNPGDEQQYKSAEFDLLLFDEVTEFTEGQYTFMLSRCRSARGHRAHVVATSNPEGAGFRWVKRRWVAPRPEDLAEGQALPEPGVPWEAPVIEDGHIIGWHPARAFLPATVTDNPGLMAANPQYVRQLQALPDGRLRRALLDGDWSAMDQVPGALWAQDILDLYRVTSAPDLIRVVIGVDPNGTSAQGDRECGIIAAGRDSSGHFYVIADESGPWAPDVWAGKVAALYHRLGADRVVAERNYGGEMVASTLLHAEPDLPVEMVNASRGKAVRAEPVAVLTQRGRVHPVNRFPDLEDQLCTWSQDASWSPDRLDAFTWAMTELAGGSTALAFLTQVSAPCPECKVPNLTGRPTCVHCGAPLPHPDPALTAPAALPPAPDLELPPAPAEPEPLNGSNGHRVVGGLILTGT